MGASQDWLSWRALTEDTENLLRGTNVFPMEKKLADVLLFKVYLLNIRMTDR